MKNLDLIIAYVSGNNAFENGSNLFSCGDVLINYKTEICRIDRDNKTAELNTRCYSRTTSKHQNALRRILTEYGFTVTEYYGPKAYFTKLYI